MIPVEHNLRSGHGCKVVLVVDDEALVRMNAVDLFEEMGFEVLEASNGLEALAKLEERPDISLLFSDCRMPGMTGPELADKAAARWPHLRVVLATGYVHLKPTGWPLLLKPYDARAIVQIIGQQP